MGANASSGRTGRSRGDEAIALSLASGGTVAQAATAGNVSEATVYRRLQDASFAARVQELRDSMIQQAAGALANSMNVATLVLRSLLTSQSENIKLRAADLLLGHAIKIAEVTQLQRRLEEVERLLSTQGKR